jgi:hypothetical protein
MSACGQGWQGHSEAAGKAMVLVKCELVLWVIGGGGSVISCSSRRFKQVHDFIEVASITPQTTNPASNLRSRSPTRQGRRAAAR